MMTTWKLTCLVIVYGALVSQMRSFLQRFWRSSPRWLHRWLAETPRPCWLCALCCFSGGTTLRLLPLLARRLSTPSLLLRSLMSTRGSCLPLKTLLPPLEGPIGSGSPRATAFIVRTLRPLLTWGGRFLV